MEQVLKILLSLKKSKINPKAKVMEGDWLSILNSSRGDPRLEETLQALAKLGINRSSSGDASLIQRSILNGFRDCMAGRVNSYQYKTLDGQIVRIHPSSVLFKVNPELVCYLESDGEYIKYVGKVEEAVKNFI